MLRAWAGILILSSLMGVAETAAPKKVNKLLYMYRFYYLPFSLDFREGRGINDILPFLANDNPDKRRLLQAEELQSLDKDWDKIRASWRLKSLLLTTDVSLNQSVRITPRLASHKIPLTRDSFDALSISDRIQATEMLKGKSPEVQAGFRQLRFLKSFLTSADEDKFNFFVVSPTWCESSKEYRMLLEGYFKQFPNSEIVLHSILVEDPKEGIFDSKVVKELFPHPELYSHESVPRFLALKITQGNHELWEEGEALKKLYEGFFQNHRGFLDSKASLFSGGGPKQSPSPARVDRSISSPRK